jgi:hypothetical protein
VLDSLRRALTTMTVVVGRSDANLLCVHPANHWCLAVKTDESQRPPDAPHWATTALMISGISLLLETYIKGRSPSGISRSLLLSNSLPLLKFSPGASGTNVVSTPHVRNATSPFHLFYHPTFSRNGRALFYWPVSIFICHLLLILRGASRS